MKTLYPHQQELNNACRASMLAGRRAVLIQGATGIGKSICAAHQIYASRKKDKKSFFTVPRKQLITQMSKTFDEFGITHSYIASGKSFNPYAQTYICSVQTLIKRLDSAPKPDLIFVDEAHLGGNSLNTIIKHYKAQGTYFIFLSATPQRLDGKGLGRWADDMVCGPSIRWLVDNKYLSEYRLFAPSTPDLSDIKTTMGDYAKGQLNERMEQDMVLVGNAVDHYIKKAHGRLNVAFCTSIKHSNIVAESFRNAGIPACHMDGETPMHERRRIIRAFARREILVITNVEILTTGFDLATAAGMEVTVESLSDLRPTKSLALQLQKWGRVLRKKDFPAIIFDHAGNAGRFGLPCSDREWTLEDQKKTKKSPGEAVPVTRQCPKCYFVHSPAPSCPECGHVYVIKSREIDEVDGELQEIDRAQQSVEKRKEQVSAHTLNDLIEIGKKRKYKNPAYWASKVLAGRMMKNK